MKQVYTSSPFDETKSKGVMFFSVYLEEKFAENFLDSPVDIIVHDIVLEPLPFKSTSALVLMTSDGHEPSGIPFIKFDCTQAENLAQKVLEYTMKNERVWASQTVSIPTVKDDGRQYLFKFPILKSMLSRNLSFYLMTRDESAATMHPLPNVVIGMTEVCDMPLKTLLYSMSDEHGMIPLQWSKSARLHRAFEDSRGQLALTVKLQESLEPEGQAIIDKSY